MPDALGLTATTPTDTALALILQACGRDLDVQLAAFLDSPDHDAPRKARVALRRMTTTLDAFAPLLRKGRRQKLRRRAKALFRLLGQVRDADVISRAAEPRSDALRASTRKALRKTDALTLGARLQSQRLLDRMMRGGRAARRARRAPLSALATLALTRARATCLAQGPDLARLSDKKIHALRKDLKAWRYLAEFFAPCWPHDAMAAERRARFQAIQDALGLLTDQALIRKAGGALATEAGPDAMIRAQGLWSQFLVEPPWWLTPAAEV